MHHLNSSKDKPMKNITRRFRGFTLIELLVVVLILAILMAVALPLYLSSQQNAEKRTCRANMQTIANAVQAAKVTQKLTDYSTFVGVAVSPAAEPDLQSTPICPSQGTYSIENGNGGTPATFRVRCSVAAHSTFEPGLDSQ
jgi:type IV pilus assembly protein PilA